MRESRLFTTLVVEVAEAVASSPDDLVFSWRLYSVSASPTPSFSTPRHKGERGAWSVARETGAVSEEDAEEDSEVSGEDAETAEAVSKTIGAICRGWTGCFGLPATKRVLTHVRADDST